MVALTFIIFIAGYFAIAFEHPLKLNKTATALLTGVFCWLLYFLQADSKEAASEVLLGHLGEISSILFFLLGAMTIVEIIDTYNGFDVITRKITTTKKGKLVVIVCVISFFLSAFLDNLTTAIVMASLCQKILADKEDRLWFAGMIIISANAGGAWSPLGDVTTTMLWIGGQISAFNIIAKVLLPSIMVCVVPLLIVFYKFQKEGFKKPTLQKDIAGRESSVVLIAGIILLLFVPVFKTVTHMPPFMGMLASLSFMWILTTFIQHRKNLEGEKFSVSGALRKIDTPSILFFMGILLAVAALQSIGILKQVAGFLDASFSNHHSIAITLGVLSALVDNVPLVAASQGMYDLSHFPKDHSFWEFLALTTGTGGSAIIIGSAAGVAVMGIEKIDFMWYLKKISWLALIGFVAGILTFMAQEAIFG